MEKHKNTATMQLDETRRRSVQLTTATVRINDWFLTGAVFSYGLVSGSQKGTSGCGGV